MMKKLICVLTLALLMIGGISTVKAQDLSGRDFWFSIPSNNGGTAAGNSYYFYAISPYCITNAVLEIPQLNYRTTFNITPGQYTQITLPNNVAGQPVFHTADRQVQKKGIHVFANQPMSLYAVVYSQASVDGEIILPTDKLGTEYVITGRSYGGNNPSRATIFATENGTAVTIKTWTLGNTSMAPSVQQTLTVNLNAGETYMFSRSSYNCNQDHSNAFTNQIDCATLTGSVITSNKPVGVISHTECSGFIACGACDVLMAQLLPTNQWGSEYVTAQVQKRNAPAITCLAGGTEAEDFSGDVLEIVGEVGTNVTIRSTSGTTTRTIAAPAYGNYGYGYLFWQNPPNPGAEQYSESNCIISSDKPVQILQYSRGYQSDAVPTGFPPQVTGNTDPESIVVYPRSYWQDSYLLATLAPVTSPITRAIIVVNDIGTPLPTTTIQLNGAAVAGPWQSFGQVDANNNWKFTRVNTPVLNTSTLVSTAGYKFSFYLTAVGQAESYALQGGQFFDITACTNCPIADIIVPKETCPNVPVTFTNRSQPGAGGSPLPTSYEWDFGDGSPIVTTTTVSDVTHTYTTGGVFNVTMTVTFAGPPICKEKVTYPITVFPVININAGQDALTCPGVAVNLGGAPTASGGTGALAYSWTPATALNSSIIPNPVSTPSATTTYTLEVTDSRGCKNTDQVLVTVNPPSSASLTPGGTICTGESFEFTVNITGGGNYDIVVTDGAGNNINLNNIPNGHKFTVTPSGTTDYRITSISRAGSNFCMTFDPVNQRVTVRPTPGLNISNGGTICSGSSFPMTATFTQTGTWNYSFSDGTNTTNRNNNSAATSNFTVSPTSTTTYTVNKVEYANAPLCTVNPNKTFTITVNNIPNPGVGSNITICKSATPVDLSTRFQTAPDPGGSFVDVSSSGALTGSIFNPASAAIGSYTIEHVVPGASPCPSAKSVFTINVVGPPQVTNIVENCDATLSSFTVRGTVTGGDPSTYSSSGGTFSQSGGTWTFTSSTSYPTKSNYTINIDDANQCGPTTISGFKNCGCLTNAGTMSTAVVEKCETDPAVATHNNNAVMLASDVLRFYLHEGSGLSLQGIIDSATTPSFSFRPGMIYGQTYYISAVAGPNLNNFPDRSSDCISISQGTPIRFFRQVTGSMTGVNSICIGSSSALQFTFSGIGPFTAEVSDGTSNTTYNALSATDSKLVTPGQTTDYVLVRIRDRYCDNTSPNGIAQRVTVNAAPTLYPATLTRVCNNTATAYTLTMEFDGGDPNSYAAVPASLGSISQAANGRYVYTSTPISNNTNFSVAIDDANACGPVTITDNYTCPCITQAGTLNNNLVQACDGSPLTIPAQTGAVLDANDAVQYVVHTNPGNPLASAVKTVNSNTIPQFGLNLGQTYFVTAIYGNDLGGGTVNSSDACFVFSNSSRIRFNALPTATMSGNNTICQFQSTPLNFNFTGAAPFTVTYDTVNQVTPTVATLAGTTGSVSVSPLDSTIYRLISVVDNNGCSNAAVGQVLISVNVAPVVRIVTNDTTICSGALQVNAVLQGTPPFNFTFNYGSTTDVRTGYTQLTFGRTIPGITMPTVCTITGVSDGNCPGPPSNTITITPVALPTGTIATPAAICDGIGFPVDLTLTGLAPFSVTVNQNGRDTTVTVPGNTFSFPASYSRGNNTYRLGRIIASGDPVNKIPSCRTNNANRSSVTLVNDLPSASISGLRNICKGETSFISINTSIGAAPIQVNYQDNFGNTFTEQMTLGTTDVTHTPTNSGDNHYTITGITDNNGCIGIGTGQATISVYDSPTVAFNVINNTGCAPVTATIIPNVTVTGGFTGTWNFGNGQTSTQPGNQTQTYGAPGSYTISYDVISQFGCKGSYSLPNAVQVQGYPKAAFTYAPDKPTVVKNIVDFQNLSSIDATAFEWRFGDGDSAFVIHPTHTYPDTEAVYVAQLKAFTSFGCADSITSRIAIGPEMQVFVPTSFSPNGDGSNDLFFPVITDNSTEGRNAYEFRIYNRWGQLIFETYDHTQGWDGRFNGELVKPDTYVWVMKIRPKGSGDAKFYEGQVTIIR